MKFELDKYINLEETVKRINDVDGVKLSLFLKKIVERYQPKEEIVFGSEEEKRIVLGLGLNEVKELHSISKLFQLMLKQAVYHLMTTSSFRNELSHLGFSEDTVLVLSEVWSTNRKELLMRVAAETSLAENRLSSVDWSLSLIMAKDCLSGPSHVRPSAIFDLGITRNNAEKGAKVLSMEFDHKRLYEFYSQLETIQQQLDSLTS